MVDDMEIARRMDQEPVDVEGTDEAERIEPDQKPDAKAYSTLSSRVKINVTKVKAIADLLRSQGMRMHTTDNIS